MALQTVTVHLPQSLYRQIEQRANQMRRSVEDELVEVVSATLPTLDDLPTDLAGELAQLALLNDAELKQAARTTLSAGETDRMQNLLQKQQREGLTSQEAEEAKRLAQLYDRTILIRAQAAALLKKRGHDPEITPPS